jgi:tagatose-1,6-bisphosphate aldolase non-catalytic subunit AgaZ/GatZ
VWFGQACGGEVRWAEGFRVAKLDAALRCAGGAVLLVRVAVGVAASSRRVLKRHQAAALQRLRWLVRYGVRRAEGFRAAKLDGALHCAGSAVPIFPIVDAVKCLKFIDIAGFH